MLERSTPEFADLLGAAICALSRHFCGVSIDAKPAPGGVLAGRDKLDPVYVTVTEGRDGPGPVQRAHYSSCGDQLHAILQRVGVRLPFVNRASLKQYLNGANIARLQHPACPFAREAQPHAPAPPPPGSLCLIWTSGYDAHAFVVLGTGSDSMHLLTANYGAGGMSSATAPGANIADSPLSGDPAGFLHVGGSHRRLHTIITPASIVPFIDAQIDLSGAAVTGEVIDALGARYDE